MQAKSCGRCGRVFQTSTAFDSRLRLVALGARLFDAPHAHSPKVLLGFYKALFGSPAYPRRGLHIVLGERSALFVHLAEVVLRAGMAVTRRFTKQEYPLVDRHETCLGPARKACQAYSGPRPIPVRPPC